MENGQFSIYQRFYPIAIFTVIGGFLESYTYILCGHVFCNAQTGNFAMLALNIANGDFLKSAYYIIPIVSYIIGIWLTIEIPRHMPKNSVLTWQSLFVLIEIIAFFIFGLIPESANYSFTTIPVSFLCAVQYNTFSLCHGLSLATTFCTNNLRQVIINFTKAIDSHEKQYVRTALIYLSVLGCFVFGVLGGSLIIKAIGRYSIWICCIILIPILILFLKNSIDERNKISCDKCM